MAKMHHHFLSHKYTTISHCLKTTQNVAYDFLILALSTNFSPIKTDRSGNTVLTASFRFLKTCLNRPFLAFLINFCPLATMLNATFLWFSNYLYNVAFKVVFLANFDYLEKYVVWEDCSIGRVSKHKMHLPFYDHLLVCPWNRHPPLNRKHPRDDSGLFQRRSKCPLLWWKIRDLRSLGKRRRRPLPIVLGHITFSRSAGRAIYHR